MHIAVLYQHYNTPDCPSTGRFFQFFRRWAPRHGVSLIASSAYRAQRLSCAFPWTPEGVALHEVDVPYANAMRPARRLRAFAAFAGRAFLAGLRLPRPAVIVGISTPLTTAAAAALLARVRGVPWVFVVKDLWPDFPIQMGAVPGLLHRPLYALERALYRSAAHVIVFSPDMAAHVRRLGVPGSRVTMQFNGTDFDLIDAVTDADVAALRAEHGLERKRVALYAGTYGRANDIATLLAAAERLRHRDDLRFVFVGDGYHAPAVREAAARRPGVVAIPPQPRHRMFGWFRLADVALVPFLGLPVLAANSPAKLFDSLGAGTPVVVTNPGWTKRFVEEHGCGWYVPPSDPAALGRRLEQLWADPTALEEAGRRGAEIARVAFDRAALADAMEAILERVAAAP